MSRLTAILVIVLLALCSARAPAQLAGFLLDDDAGPVLRVDGCARADADAEFVAGACKKGQTLSCYNCIKTACSDECTTHCQDICDGLLFARVGMEGLLDFYSADQLTVDLIASGYFEQIDHWTFYEADIVAALAFRATDADTERWARALASDRVSAIQAGGVTADDDARKLIEKVVLDGLQSSQWKVRYVTYNLLHESGIGLGDIGIMADVVRSLEAETNARVRARGEAYLTRIYVGG